MRTKLNSLAFVVVFATLTLSAGFLYAETTMTPQDHRAKAEEYKKQAADYRAIAVDHQKMLADYKKEFPSWPKAPVHDPVQRSNPRRGGWSSLL